MPSSTPAAPSSSAPVQTDVVYLVVSWEARIQSTIGPPSAATRRVTSPPGTSSTSGAGTSSNVCARSRCSRSLSSARSPFRSAHTTTSAPGTLVNTAYGPMASRAVNPGYRPMAICTLAFLSGSPPAEVLAVAIGCGAETAMERAVQRLGVLHTDATRHGRDGEIGCLEQPPRRLDTKPLDEDRRRRAGLASEGACERAGAHAGARREVVDGEALVEVVAEPRLQLGDRGRGGALGAELGAELRLTAGALHEHDEPPCDLVRDRRAVVR